MISSLVTFGPKLRRDPAAMHHHDPVRDAQTFSDLGG